MQWLHARKWLDPSVSSPVQVSNSATRAAKPLLARFFDAVAAGDLGLCKRLYAQRETALFDMSSIVRKGGDSPLAVACKEGHLHVARWISEEGGCEGVSSPNNLGQTPLYHACAGGHLHVVEWLVKDTRATCSDICHKDELEESPFFVAALHNHVDVVVWLLLAGAADQSTGAADQGGVEGAAVRRAHLLHTKRAPRRPSHQPTIYAALRKLLEFHSAFVALVLVPMHFTQPRVAVKLVGCGNDMRSSEETPAVVSASEGEAEPLSDDLQPAAARGVSRCCPFAMLRGHEATILQLIADFSGVIRKRHLRRARQAASLLGAC